MSAQDMPAVPGRLAFGVTLRASFGIVFGRFGLFLRAAVVPVLLSLVIAAFEHAVPTVANTISAGPGMEVTEGVLLILVGCLSLFPYSILGVVLIRIYLDGPRAGTLPQPFPGRRVWRYFGYSLLMALAFLLALGVVVLPVAVLAEGGFGEPAVGGVWILLAIAVFFAVILYLLLRLSLVFPAIAMDDGLRLRGSWRLTRNGSLKLFVVFGLLLLLQLLAMLAGTALFGQPDDGVTVSEIVAPDERADLFTALTAGTPQALWNMVVSLLAVAMMTGALASAFAQLSGWGAPRQEILQRFE
jgi:hypothetical protein